MAKSAIYDCLVRLVSACVSVSRRFSRQLFSTSQYIASHRLDCFPQPPTPVVRKTGEIKITVNLVQLTQRVLIEHLKRAGCASRKKRDREKERNLFA